MDILAVVISLSVEESSRKTLGSMWMFLNRELDVPKFCEVATIMLAGVNIFFQVI